ncbi:MGH1-like glycoside hydrolase domain-containing protein [Candidatus Laterigemmans baculatus]|uniref:MGH1-like glycoside hydrolase domain-containing protein n=1 Tax=Candidatus Laterigemmans baculatus TaxID=2770505 RepID=UPI00193B2833|nr:glucosidase [Candidatus Laterigemmans baculatus]
MTVPCSDRDLFRSTEDHRLALSEHREENWQRWGPYLSERQWGTVREDYSPHGDSWNYFPHDHARSRAYRWGEDGLLGWSDRECRLCVSLALWNGRDPILKERLFGLNGPEGNHGEDVKECYYYLDSTPTHSYARGLYKYPQARFPYEDLTEMNRARDRSDPEYELTDTGLFDGDRYFDVLIEYAKAAPNDILFRYTITNAGPQAAILHVLPQVWFRNTWTWECTEEGRHERPRMWLDGDVVRGEHQTLGGFEVFAEPPGGASSTEWIFTDNDTNPHRHPGLPSGSEYFKDAFHQYVIRGNTAAVNPHRRGTKAAAYSLLVIPAGERRQIRLRLRAQESLPSEAPKPSGEPNGEPALHVPAIERELDHEPSAETAVKTAVKTATPTAAQASAVKSSLGPLFGAEFEQVFTLRQREADEFYALRIPETLDEESRRTMRQAYAGMLWSKQFYYYSIEPWLEGDPAGPEPPPERKHVRNSDWRHLFNRDLLAMPDKWEYPWYAAWDSAFHMVPMADLDTHFAKEQLILFLREWYMHPNGQIPAYEWKLSDVNPPVHAWACWQVYKMTGPPKQRDTLFLARVFQKLLLNFTWWVNRKDPRGRHVFTGGFLGLDNIGIFDRSKPLPGGYLEQADGTAWMAFYCGSMLRIALELADGNPAYGDMASKFFEHYIAIAEAMNSLDGTGLWDEEDGFYYDHLYLEDHGIPMRIRSLVGLIPLLTSVIIEDAVIEQLPGFNRRTEWFVANRGHRTQHMTYMESEDAGREGFPRRRLLAIPSEDRFRRLLAVMLDEAEFLSPHGIRSLSAAHLHEPFVFELGGQRHEVRYVPGESDSGMFGGNSNWRGPVWFPLNYLIVQSLRRYHSFYGDSFQVECPTGSGNMMTLLEVAHELERRLISIFQPNAEGDRPAHGGDPRYRDDPRWKDLILFYEYFHGDDGRGLGASHQTGWTALVATLLRSQGAVMSSHDHIRPTPPPRRRKSDRVAGANRG